MSKNNSEKIINDIYRISVSASNLRILYDCSNKNIDVMNIPYNIDYIENSFCNNFEDLAKVYIPSGVSICSNCFTNLPNLKEVIFEGETFIGGGSFSNCTNVIFKCERDNSEVIDYAKENKIKIKKVKDIFEPTIDECDDIYLIKEESEVTLLECLDHNIEIINVPDGVTHIAESAINDFPNLLSISFPRTLKYIDLVAFYNLPNLNEITFESDCKIEDGAFEECPNVIFRCKIDDQNVIKYANKFDIKVEKN